MGLWELPRLQLIYPYKPTPTPSSLDYHLHGWRHGATPHVTTRPQETDFDHSMKIEHGTPTVVSSPLAVTAGSPLGHESGGGQEEEAAEPQGAQGTRDE